MLFLRRSAGRSITFIREGKVIAKTTFLRVDLAASEIDVQITSGPATKTITLRQGEKTSFLEGLIVLKLSFLLDYAQYPPAASIGIRAPRSIAIYRSERLTGLGPKQIAALRQE